MRSPSGGWQPTRREYHQGLGCCPLPCQTCCADTCPPVTSEAHLASLAVGDLPWWPCPAGHQPIPCLLFPQQLELDSRFQNHTCGLCGDYNGLQTYSEFLSDGEGLPGAWQVGKGWAGQAG